MWEVGASQLQSWLSRGWAGCNLHSAHLRERREEKKPLPPSRKLPFPCGSVSFHIKMDPLLLQHSTSLLLPSPTAAPSHSLILKVFRRLEIEGSGNDQEMMTGQSGAWLSPFHVKTLKVAWELCCDRMIPEAAQSHSLLRWRQTH